MSKVQHVFEFYNTQSPCGRLGWDTNPSEINFLIVQEMIKEFSELTRKQPFFMFSFTKSIPRFGNALRNLPLISLHQCDMVFKYHAGRVLKLMITAFRLRDSF
jgi:hypothetical protein